MNKSFFGFFVFFLFLTPVFAYTLDEKASIMSAFSKREQEIIFKSEFDASDFSANDLFKVTKNINLYDNIKDQVTTKREYLEENREKVLISILSLESSIKKLEEDMESLKKEVNKLNVEVVDTKQKIKNNTARIEFLSEKVEESMSVLIDYIIYLYKKGNIVIEDGKIDNLKVVLMSSADIDEIINDLHYKELVGMAGKKLIDKHRTYIFSLYSEKKDLEESQSKLKKLRKNFLIKKKIINDKKEFKKRLLEESKGKESLYQKYIKEKVDLEKSLKVKAFKERIKFNEISKDLLGKYNCKYVDITKNTPEKRSLSDKCLELNKLIHAESQLKSTGDAIQNVFSWPIAPLKGISSYFRDTEYLKDFGVDHDGIDIVADQGTDIVAPLDGYVTYIVPPVNASYAYIALKHADGYVTVYGHVSEVLVEKYDFVKAGEVFARSGGIYGTIGAGYMTTGAHLHFEVFKDRFRRDPMEFLNISLLSFDYLPAKYRFKFFADYKERTGSEYKEKVDDGKRVFKLDGSTEVERQKSLLYKYARSDFADWNVWIEESLHWNIDPTFMMCIGLAESSLGRNLTTSYNVGNVGNTDSGERMHLNSPRDGIYFIGQTLNNKFLGNINSVGLLSGSGRRIMGEAGCSTGPGSYCYATDPYHWHDNVIKCMSFIKGRLVSDDYNFRLK